jgi:hypothetical protein
MKSDLKRIEVALQRAGCQTHPPSNPILPAVTANPFRDWSETVTESSGLSVSNSSSDCYAAFAGELDKMVPVAMALSSSNISKSPDLPEFVVTVSEVGRQQAMATPALATNLLSDLHHRVQEWSIELQQILEQIQALHAEGAVVEGWLESCGTTYRLCGVNEEGQLWHRPCPPEQIREISLSIVRYQRLQKLLGQKRSLEIRLTYLTETLLSTYSRLAELS